LFFFLTLFIQNVLGYSAIRSGIAYLPFAIGVVIASALASQLVRRIGPCRRREPGSVLAGDRAVPRYDAGRRTTTGRRPGCGR
jgi:hypothetical protein